MFLRSVIFPYNSLYTQAVAYTTYFELGAPVLRLTISIVLVALLKFTNYCIFAVEKFSMLKNDVRC